MPNIARELHQFVLDYKNEATAQVTTATKLDKSTQSQVQQALERMTGKKIMLETRVQPNILGGVVARVGDQVIDGSVERRLKLLQQQLLTDVSSASIDFFAEPGTEVTELSGDGHKPAPLVSNIHSNPYIEYQYSSMSTNNENEQIAKNSSPGL